MTFAPEEVSTDSPEVLGAIRRTIQIMKRDPDGERMESIWVSCDEDFYDKFKVVSITVAKLEQGDPKTYYPHGPSEARLKQGGEDTGRQRSSTKGFEVLPDSVRRLL